MITAIIPIDDAKNGLKNFLTWMTNSNLESFEIIVVLDTDSMEIHQTITNLRQKLTNLQILVTSSGGRNPGTSRNIGLSLALGSWVCFWDADDLPEPSKFVEMAGKGDLEKADIVVGDYLLVTQNNRINSENKVSTTNVGQIYRNPGLWRILFKKELLAGTVFPEICMAEDQIFVFRILSKCGKVSFFNKAVYRYYKYESGQLTQNPKKFDDLRRALTLVEDGLIKDDKLRNLIKIRMARSCVKNGTVSTKIFGLKMYLGLTFKSVLLKLLRLRNEQGNTNKAIYLPLTGGMGNQLFQLAAAFHFSKGVEVVALSTIGKPRVRTDGQVEVASLNLPQNIRIRNYQKPNSFITKCFGYILRSGISPSNFERNRLFRWLTQRAAEVIFSIYLRKRVRIAAAQDVGYDENIDLSSGNTLLIGYFQSYKYVSDSFVESLKLTKSTKFEEIDQIQREADKDCPLVVHVRLGDYRNDSTLGVLDEIYYASNVIKEWDTGKYQSIWLFSDEPNEALLRIPKKLQSHTRIFLPGDWNTAETLTLMSMGHGYVLANSSFSWWSARMSKESKDKVIVPTPWFVGQKSPNELNPPSWKSTPRNA